MLYLNYWTKIWKLNDNQSRAGWTEYIKKEKNEGIDNADKKKNLSGHFFLSGQLFCPDNYFVWTKGHLPPSRILPTRCGQIV